MAHPALVAVFIGIGVAAVLYYMFVDDEESQQQQQQQRTNNSSRSHNNSWTPRSDGTSFRRRSSTVSSGNNDDCSICLYPLSMYKMVSLQPCQHIFHKKCIDQWKSESTGVPSCPNCRREIRTYV